MAAPTRCHLIAGLGAVPLASLAAVPAVALDPAHLDAELIGLCDRLVALEHRWRTDGDAVTDSTDEALRAVLYPLWGERDVLLARVHRLSATTGDGVAALLRVIAAANPQDTEGERENSFDGGFIEGLLEMALCNAVTLGQGRSA